MASKKKLKFIPCDEDAQVFNFQRTYKKAAHRPKHVVEKIRLYKIMNNLVLKKNKH